MQTDKDDIPKNQDRSAKLLDYLDGKLPEDQRQQLEEEIARSAFLQEALEGLQPIKGTMDIREVTRQLNQQLRKQISARKRPRRVRPAISLLWIVVALAIVLTIILLGYYFYARL